MGMCLGLHSVSDENIKKILESPILILKLLAPEDPEFFSEALEEERNKRNSFFSKLFHKKIEKNITPVTDLVFVEGENIDDDLDKSWQGIHFCLNETACEAIPPMDFIIEGGENAGDIEVGLGPARLINSETVKEINIKISNISREQLYKKYNPSEMEKLDIYPNIWERDGDEGFEYIWEYFETLKQFICSCSKHNVGMALYLT